MYEITEKTIEIEGISYVIKKIPLGKYAVVLGSLSELPNIFRSMASLDKDSIIKALPSLVQTSYPELKKILHIATDIPEEILDANVGIADLSEIVLAMLEVNGFNRAKKNFTTLTTSTTTIEQLPKTQEQIEPVQESSSKSETGCSEL